MDACHYLTTEVLFFRAFRALIWVAVSSLTDWWHGCSFFSVWNAIRAAFCFRWMDGLLLGKSCDIYLLFGTVTWYRFRRVSLFWFTKKKCREEDPGRQHTDNSLTILLKCMVCMAWYNLISLCTMQFWFFLRSWHRKLEIYTLHLVISIAAFILFYGCHLVQTITELCRLCMHQCTLIKI